MQATSKGLCSNLCTRVQCGLGLNCSKSRRVAASVRKLRVSCPRCQPKFALGKPRNCTRWPQVKAELSRPEDLRVLASTFTLISCSALQDLLGSLDHGGAKLKSAGTVADKVIPSTSKRGRKGIKEQLDRLRKNHSRLQGNINDARKDLQATLSKWGNLEQLLDDLQAWLRDTQEKLKAEAQPRLDLGEKKAQLDKAKAIQKVGSLFERCSAT